MRCDHLTAVTLGLAVMLWAGFAAAGPGEGYGARHEATVTFIDRNLNLVHLDDGTELRARDSRVLERIHEGMRVVVDVTTADLTPSTLD